MSSKFFGLSRTASTVLAVVGLVAALGIVGTAGQALMARNTTATPVGFPLPLWPSTMDSNPSFALICCGVIILVAATISLVACRKVPSARPRAFLIMTAPLVALIAALTATAIRYFSDSSTTTDSLQSWSCRWNQLAMLQPPYFGSLCTQTRAALYLCVLLVPVELLAVAAAAVQIASGRSAATAKATSGKAISGKAMSGKAKALPC